MKLPLYLVSTNYMKSWEALSACLIKPDACWIVVKQCFKLQKFPMADVKRRKAMMEG